MCNLCRISINCLLLISIVSAVPLGRHKRNISFFKDLLISAVNGIDAGTLQIPDVRAEPDCMIYIVPDYSDIMFHKPQPSSHKAQPIETAADEIAIPYEGKKIRTHIGTKNFADTDQAIHNVHKLTKIRMHDSAAPMINGRNAVKLVVEENITPHSVKSEKIQTHRRKVVSTPRRNERVKTVNFEGAKYLRPIPVLSETVELVTPEKLAPNRRLRLLKPVEAKYSPKLIERTGPIIRFTPRRYPMAKHREHFITLPNVPMPRIDEDEVVSLADDEYHIVPVIGNHYLYSRHQFIPSESKYYKRNTGKKIVPLNPKPLPLVESDNHKVIHKHLSHMNKLHEKIAPDENNTLKMVQMTPKIYHNLNTSTTDNMKTNDFHEQKGKIHFQKNHNNSKLINIVKEKDKINTDTPFVNEPSVKNITPIIVQTKDKNLKIVKTGDDLPKAKTLAQYINDLVRNNKTHIVDIEKFKDEVQTYINTDLTNFMDIDSILEIVSKSMNNSNITVPIDIKLKNLKIPKDKVDITPIVDVMSLNNNNNSNIIIPTDIKTKDETAIFKPQDVSFSKEMYTLVNRTDPQSLSAVENSDNIHAIVKNTVSFHNSPVTINESEAKTDDNKTVAGKESADSQNSSSQDIQITSKPLNNLENNYTKSKDFTISKDDAYITPNQSISINSSNLIKPDIKINPTEFIPKDLSFSQNIYDPVNYINLNPLNEMEDRDNLKVNNNLVKSNDNSKSEDIDINVGDKVSNNSKYIDSQLGNIIFNLLNLLEENHEPKTNFTTSWNQNISFSHIIGNLSTVFNNSNIMNTTHNNSQNLINQTVFNIAPDENKIKTNIVTTSPRSIDNDYMQAITNSPPISYIADQINNDKKETINTEKTTVSSNIKLALGDTKNDQIPFKGNLIVATDDAPAVQQNNINDSSVTVNGNDEKSNNIRETTMSRGDIPDASF